MSETKSVYVTRAPKGAESRFTRIMNTALQDNRLSFRARGLLALVLSMPPTWVHSAKRLAGRSREGEDAVRVALRELVALGYASIRKSRGPGGRLISNWHFVECPPDAKKPDPVPQDAMSPDAILPGAGQPGSGKTPPSETTIVETTIIETTVERAERAEGTTAKAVRARAVPMPLPKTVEEAGEVAQGLGLEPETGGAFWNMMTAKGWTIRGRQVRDWKAALVAWGKTDEERTRNLKPDRISNAEFWAFVTANEISHEAANDYLELVAKKGGRLLNRLTGRLEPVRDHKAALKAFVESDLNQDFERRGSR